MASRPRIRATCKSGRTWPAIRANLCGRNGHAPATAHFADTPLYTPVNAVVPGRRNNPPDPAAGIRSLAVFNPIHYMELPELFMEFISSMTGKSPSTTGAGSEGALTKGPFNALPPIIDLNAALVVLRADRLRRVHFRRGPHRAQGAGGSRHQPADPGSLVPHDAGGTAAGFSD
jgi:hypothetical protein